MFFKNGAKMENFFLETNVFWGHLGVLVPSVFQSAERFQSEGFWVGEIQEYPQEGTREVYIGEEEQRGRLLLMEAVSEGPYWNAWKKRGTGIHHLAIGVSNVKTFLQGLEGSGWFLHLRSLKTIPQGGTAWLVRPGYPLIEVYQMEGKWSLPKEVGIEKVFFNFAEKAFFEVLGLGSWVEKEKEEGVLMRGVRFGFQEKGKNP